MPDIALTSIGRYNLQAELGHGGFATVYRATDTTLEREVALKVLKPGWTDDVRAVERFMREAKQVSRLKHPNIVTIYDVGQAEGRLFIAMELVPGRSLQQIIAEDGALPWPRMLAILEQSASALDYAHKQGLVHRDIKPANIILDESDPKSVRAMLTDFGLVRGAEQASLSTGTTGGLIGTPEYIAPEIWNGKAATKASDIYALGCVVFYLLTGQVLFSATTPMAVLMRHVEGPVFPAQWPSGVPASAEAVLRRALAKEPNERPTSAVEFVSALREGEPGGTAEQKVKSTVQAELDAAQPKVREEQERLRQIEVAAQAAADNAKREWDSERAERQRQASEEAALEKARREAAERERWRQPVEQESRHLITESSQPETGLPLVKVKSNRRWVFAAGGVVAVFIAVMALANIKPPSSTPTAAPVATKYVPTQPPKPTDAPMPTEAPKPTQAPAVLKSKDPTTFTFQTYGEPDTLDPAVDYESSGASVLLNVMEGLITFDGADPLKFKPQLAKSIPGPIFNADGSVTYVWNIVDGVKFGNGDPLMAHDVAYSFWRAMLVGDYNTPAFLMTQAFLGADIDDVTKLVDPSGALVGNPDALKKADSNKLVDVCNTVKKTVRFDDATGTVTMILPKPWGPFLPTLASGAWAFVSDYSWVKAQGDWNSDCTTWQNFYSISSQSGVLHDKVNGTGPYQLDHWTPNVEIVLTANPNYRKGIAKINRYIIKYVNDMGTRFSALEAGDADNISVSSADYPQMDKLVQNDCNITAGQCTPYLDANGQTNPTGILRRYLHVPGVTRSDLFMNPAIATGSPYIGSGKLDGNGVPQDFLANVNIRRAFNYCFDTSTYIKQVFNGEAVPGLALTLPGQPGYAGTPAYTFDLNQCATAFKGSTLKSADGSKLLWDAGFYMQLAYNTGNTSRQAAAQILADGVHGVNSRFLISPVEMPWPTYLTARRAKQLTIYHIGWQEDIHDPHNWYVPYLYTSYNLLGAQKGIMAQDRLDQYQQLFNAGVYETNQTKRADIYAQLNKMVYEDALVIIGPIPESRYYEPLYLHGWFRGQTQNPLIRGAGPYVYDFWKD